MCLYLGTPLLRSPVLGHRDLDLYKLFKIVSKMKGMDKVCTTMCIVLQNVFTFVFVLFCFRLFRFCFEYTKNWYSKTPHVRT